MVRKLVGSLTTLLAGAGLVWGQGVPAQTPTPSTTSIAAQTATTWQPTSFQPPYAPAAPSPSLTPPPLLATPNVGVVTPTYHNPTNDWAAPTQGSLYLSQSVTDHSRVWFQTEYLLWWIRPGSLPTVVGTAPTSQVMTGVLPSDAITPLLGNDSNGLDYHEQSGARFNAGVWLDDAQQWGLDASYFRLEQKSLGQSFASSGDPVIGPVFFDPNTNTRNLVLASLPNFKSGPLAGDPRSAVIQSNAENRLWSVEANLRKQIGAVFFADHLDLLLGFRHLQFKEGFDLVTDSNSTAGSTTPTSLHVEDHLQSLNQFYGAQIGLASHTQAGRWSFDAIGKLALGDMHEVTNIGGSTFITTSSGNIASNSGILAEPTNSGRLAKDRFAVMPELTFNVGYQVIENVRVTAGYNFLYINSVMRAGDLIDGVDARQVRGLAAFDPTAQVTSPMFQQHDSRFWAQGVNFGVEVRY